MYDKAAIQKRMNLKSTNMTGYVFVPTNHGYSKVLDFEIWALRYLCRVDTSVHRYLFVAVGCLNDWGRLDISVENVMWNCSWSLYFSEVVEVFFVQNFHGGHLIWNYWKWKFYLDRVFQIPDKLIDPLSWLDDWQ